MKQIRAFTMPKWGIEMTEGTLAKWEISEGAAFAKGDIIALIETDKITNEVEAEFEATLARIIVPEGDTVPVGALLGVFTQEDLPADAIDSFISGLSGDAPPAAAKEPLPTPDAKPASAAPAPIPADTAISPAARKRVEATGVDVSRIAGSGRDGRISLQDIDIAAAGGMLPSRAGGPVDIAPITGHLADVFASPLAKRLAVQNDVDLGTLHGSGPRGRICKADVLKQLDQTPAVAPQAMAQQAVAQPAPPPAGDDREVLPMSAMRKAIARQLTLSKQTIPHFYLRNEARVDALLAMRKMAKQATGSAPSVNDYLVRAVALALQSHPDVNVQVHGNEIHRFHRSDISIAVATDKGLITPIVKSADTKTVAAISAEVKLLAAKAREGRLAAEEFQGGSFSVSNLGMFGITQFDAIINPPQGAILAVGAARSETFHSDHALVYAQRIHLSLSCDHRAIDGAVGAKFLAELTRLIENPDELTP